MDVATAVLAGKLAKRTAPEIRKTTEGNLSLAAVASSGQARGTDTTTALTGSDQKRYMTRISCRSLRLSYNNFVNNGAAPLSIEAKPGNQITLKAAVFVANTGNTAPAGVGLPVTWGGQTSIVLADGAKAPLSDPVEIDLPQGAYFWVVTFWTVGTIGDKRVQTAYTVGSRSEGRHLSADDTTTSGGIGAGSYANGYVYGPTQIYGVPYSDARAARLARTGDSISRGASGLGDDDGLNLIDPIVKTSVVNIAAYGEYAAQAALPQGLTKRIADIDGCTAWDCNYGINDMKGTHTYATVQAALVTVWRKLAQRLGVPGIQWTLTPFTTSTDSWATTGNQTLAASPYSNADRTAFNNWVRDGAPINGTTFAVVATGTSPAGTIRAGAAGHPLAGYFEMADAVESARDSGIWKAGYTIDGVHPSTSGYAAMAAAVDWTKLGIV